MGVYNAIKNVFKPGKVIVLMYHRIADCSIDPWQLAVSTENFREQLEVLSQAGEVISTDQLVDMVSNRRVNKNYFCITSDDAYQDNYLQALPLINEFGYPSTFYIASGSIGTDRPYWWDMLSDIFLSQIKLPSRLDISIDGRQFSYLLEHEGEIDESDLAKHESWHWPEPAPTQRSSIYLELWMHLRNLSFEKISRSIDLLTQWAGIVAANNNGSFPMTRSELLSLAASPNILTGVHTVTHAALAAFDKQTQSDEITRCKEFLEKTLNKKPQTIAFPYGFYNDDTIAATKSAGMKGAFTTEAKAVDNHSDVFRLGRFQVLNQNGIDFKKQLQYWLNN